MSGRLAASLEPSGVAMSAVETKHVWQGDYVRVESLVDRPLSSPVYFKYGAAGHYLTIEQAKHLSHELMQAAKIASDLVPESSSG